MTWMVWEVREEVRRLGHMETRRCRFCKDKLIGGVVM